MGGGAERETLHDTAPMRACAHTHRHTHNTETHTHTRARVSRAWGGVGVLLDVFSFVTGSVSSGRPALWPGCSGGAGREDGECERPGGWTVGREKSTLIPGFQWDSPALHGRNALPPATLRSSVRAGTWTRPLGESDAGRGARVPRLAPQQGGAGSLC